MLASKPSPPTPHIMGITQHISNSKTGLGTALPQSPALIFMPCKAKRTMPALLPGNRRDWGYTGLTAEHEASSPAAQISRQTDAPEAYTPLWDRTSMLQRAGAATEQSHRFPGLIPITEISSSCRLGAGSAFRLLFRAGILLWAHLQPRVKWNKITTRKHLASLFLWTRSGSPPRTLRWLWKTKSCSFCVPDPT